MSVASPVDRWQWLQLIASEHGPTSTARHILHAIAMHMNQLGESAFPSQKTIAKRTGLSERVIRTHLETAKRDGWVEISSKRQSGQGWRLNQYAATVPDRLSDLIPEHAWEADPEFKRAERSSSRLSAPKGERAALGAKGAERNARTCGTSFQNVRNHVPTKYSIKRIKSSEEGARAHARTVSKKRTRKTKTEEKPKTEEKSLHEGGAHWDAPEFKALPPDASRHAPKNAAPEVITSPADIEASRRRQLKEIREKLKAG